MRGRTAQAVALAGLFLVFGLVKDLVEKGYGSAYTATVVAAVVVGLVVLVAARPEARAPPSERP